MLQLPLGLAAQLLASALVLQDWVAGWQQLAWVMLAMCWELVPVGLMRVQGWLLAWGFQEVVTLHGAHMCHMALR